MNWISRGKEKNDNKENDKFVFQIFEWFIIIQNDGTCYKGWKVVFNLELPLFFFYIRLEKSVLFNMDEILIKVFKIAIWLYKHVKTQENIWFIIKYILKTSSSWSCSSPGIPNLSLMWPAKPKELSTPELKCTCWVYRSAQNVWDTLARKLAAVTKSRFRDLLTGIVYLIRIWYWYGLECYWKVDWVKLSWFY